MASNSMYKDVNSCYCFLCGNFAVQIKENQMQKINNKFTHVIAELDAQRHELNRLFEQYASNPVIRLEVMNARRELSQVIARIERVELEVFTSEARSNS
jgi:hypothetical protein